MRKWQHEIFSERVDQTESQFVMMVFAMNRLFGHVPQRVIHPAHVPLDAKAKAAARGWVRDATPSR